MAKRRKTGKELFEELKKLRELFKQLVEDGYITQKEIEKANRALRRG